VPLIDSCHPAGRRPNIIMIHDESRRSRSIPPSAPS
jgi:hypothetical protein